MFSKVDLPQPEAPIRQTNSPDRTVSDSRSTASTAPDPRPYTLLTSVSVIAASRPVGVGLACRVGQRRPVQLAWVAAPRAAG